MTTINEWANTILPLSNGTGMKQMAALSIPAAPTAISLGTLFGGMTPTGQHGNHFLSIKADIMGGTGGSKVYFVIAANAPTMLAQPLARGNLPGVCWPLSDGETYRGRLWSGKEAGVTGWATMVHYQTLHLAPFSAGSGAQASGFLRLQLSSTPEGQDRNPFPRP